MTVLNILLATKKMIFSNRYVFLTSNDTYINYFENGGKNVSFMIRGDRILIKYNEIWNKI